jgi:hypothetical protein
MAPFFRLSGALPLQRLFYPRTDMVHYRSPRGHALSGTSLPGAVAPPCASTIFVGVPRLGPALTVTDPCHPGASLGAFRGSPSFGSLPLVPSEVLPAPGNLPTPSVQERSPSGGGGFYVTAVPSYASPLVSVPGPGRLGPFSSPEVAYRA